MFETSGATTGTGSPVGVPTKEAALTEGIRRRTRDVIASGPGRSLFLTAEVQFAYGRPDLLFVVASSAALRAQARAGRRLRNFTEARVLGSLIDDSLATGVSRGHARAIERKLRQDGWTVRNASAAAGLAVDSLLIEAKHSEWRRGVSQLVRNSRYVHRAALLVPGIAVDRVDGTILAGHHHGLLAMDAETARIRWVIEAPAVDPATSGALWLCELAIRQLLGRVS